MFQMTKIYVFVILHICIADDYVINNKRFPENFKFGIASSAYQIEGAWNEDGKAPSIWDHILHEKPDLIDDHTNGDVACDSYHKYKEDVAMLKSLGVKYYRFSFSWTRILPNGIADKINEAGVAYYKKLLKELNDNNIEIHAAIYVWDLPQNLLEQGGFLNESIIDWYADYARVCFKLFGNDVKLWITFIEPREICNGGYGQASMAPYVKSEAVLEYVCAHNLLRAHAKAWHIYDKEFRAKQGGRVGVSLDAVASVPATNDTADVIATDTKYHFVLGQYANPIFHGDYPEIMKIRIAANSRAEGLKKSRLPEFTEEEKAWIKGTHDYFGLNVYTGSIVHHLGPLPVFIPPTSFSDQGVLESQPDSWKNTSAPYVKNVPWTVRYLLKWVKDHYNDTDIIITENGFPDYGGLEDDQRIAYIREYLSHIRDAMLEDDVKIFGYTVWSLLESFEWQNGYSVRYGMYQVDQNSPNRTRIPKRSTQFYRDVCHTRCLADNCVE